MNCKTHTPINTLKLRGNNLKATSSRLELLDIFEHAKKPLSVNEVSSKLPSSDKATLYRSVESLEKTGILKQIRFKDRQAYYEIDSTHHHHIICRKCGKIADVKDCGVSVSEKVLLKHAGFAKISDHSLEFYGLCNNCAK